MSVAHPAGYALGMDLTRRSLLASAACLAVAPTAHGAADGSGPKYLVVVLADGGWDVTFALDPKTRGGLVDGPWVDENPDDPLDREALSTIHGIPLLTNERRRPSVTRFFERYGAEACVINGIWTGSIVHQPCRIRMLTGSTKQTNPDFATVVGFEKGVSVDRPLGSIDFSGLGYAGPLAASTGRIGHRSQLKALLQDGVEFRPPEGASYGFPVFDPSEADEALVQAHLEARIASFRERYGGSAGGTDAVLDDMLESYGRRTRLLDNGELLADPLVLGVKPDLELQADMASRLLAGGLCHAVTMAHFDTWDTHDNNATQHERYQSLFSAVARLCDNLEQAGIYDDTLVVVMSEMTRTPKRNKKGGKDHWSHTSMLMVGPSVRGGTVVGGTNDSVESLPVDLDSGEVDEANGALNKYDNLAAGLIEHLGADPGRWFPGVVPFRGFAG